MRDVVQGSVSVINYASRRPALPIREQAVVW